MERRCSIVLSPIPVIKSSIFTPPHSSFLPRHLTLRNGILLNENSIKRTGSPAFFLNGDRRSRGKKEKGEKKFHFDRPIQRFCELIVLFFLRLCGSFLDDLLLTILHISSLFRPTPALPPAPRIAAAPAAPAAAAGRRPVPCPQGGKRLRVLEASGPRAPTAGRNRLLLPADPGTREDRRNKVEEKKIITKFCIEDALFLPLGQ